MSWDALNSQKNKTPPTKSIDGYLRSETEEAKLNKVSTDFIINDICDAFWQFAQSYELSCYADDVIENEK